MYKMLKCFLTHNKFSFTRIKVLNVSLTLMKFLNIFLTNIQCSNVQSMLATVFEGDQKAPFSIATTPRCGEGCYSFIWIAPRLPLIPTLYSCVLSKEVSSTIFKVFGMTRLIGKHSTNEPEKARIKCFSFSLTWTKFLNFNTHKILKLQFLINTFRIFKRCSLTHKIFKNSPHTYKNIPMFLSHLQDVLMYHHHHVVPLARISLALTCHFFLSFIAGLQYPHTAAVLNEFCTV